MPQTLSQPTITKRVGMTKVTDLRRHSGLQRGFLFLDIYCACTQDGYKVIDTSRGCTITDTFKTSNSRQKITPETRTRKCGFQNAESTSSSLASSVCASALGVRTEN